MKTVSLLRLLSVCLLTVPLMYTASAIGKPVEEEPATKAKAAKVMSSLNNKAIKIYPDIIKRDMHVVARENDGQQIDFFVFDLQGTLVQHYKMNPREHFRLAGLNRGVYIYRVFRGDVENATGKFEVR